LLKALDLKFPLIFIRYENFPSHSNGLKIEEQDSETANCEIIPKIEKHENSPVKSKDDNEKIRISPVEQVSTTRGAFTMLHDRMEE